MLCCMIRLSRWVSRRSVCVRSKAHSSTQSHIPCTSGQLAKRWITVYPLVHVTRSVHHLPRRIYYRHDSRDVIICRKSDGTMHIISNHLLLMVHSLSGLAARGGVAYHAVRQRHISSHAADTSRRCTMETVFSSL